MSSQEKQRGTSNKRRVAYSLAAGAAAGMTCSTSPEAEATVQFSPIYNFNVVQGLGAFPLDLDAYGATPDIDIQNYVFGGTGYFGASVKYAPGQLVISNSSFPYYVSALSPGDLVDSTTVGPSFAGALAFANNPNSEFDTLSEGYIGLSFPIGSNTHYGWVRLGMDYSQGTLTIKNWAYNDEPGVGLQIPVPEPSTLGMLAAGSLGLAAMRRRKRQAAQSE